jgi:hypothetical protein
MEVRPPKQQRRRVLPHRYRTKRCGKAFLPPIFLRRERPKGGAFFWGDADSRCLMRKSLVGERAARLWLIAAGMVLLSQTAR